MKKTFRVWNRETGKYESQEFDMTDVNGVLLEVGQTVIYARARKSCPSYLEKGTIVNIGDGFITIEVMRSCWNSPTKRPEKVRITSSIYPVSSTVAKFGQIYVL